MKPKTKATLYNFIGFAILYFIFRFAIDSFIELNRYVLAFGAAILATIFAPKFSPLKTEKGEKIMMKWIFIKEIKEL